VIIDLNNMLKLVFEKNEDYIYDGKIKLKLKIQIHKAESIVYLHIIFYVIILL